MGTMLKEKRRTHRLNPAGRYEGMVDTIVQLFRVYASGVITLVHAIRVNQNLVHLGDTSPTPGAGHR